MMTVPEIRDHAERLQDRLAEERRKVYWGRYGESTPGANMILIRALEGRIGELLAQCDVIEAAQAREIWLSAGPAAALA